MRCEVKRVLHLQKIDLPQFSGTEGKRHRMRESLLWIDPPEYHNRPGGFLIYK